MHGLSSDFNSSNLLLHVHVCKRISYLPNILLAELPGDIMLLWLTDGYAKDSRLERMGALT